MKKTAIAVIVFVVLLIAAGYARAEDGVRMTTALVDKFVGKDGNVYGRFAKPKCCVKDFESGKITKEEFMENWGSTDYIEEEITLSSKLIGMDDMPHPFPDVKEEDTVVLLDPMDSMTEKLVFMSMSDESVQQMFSKGYLRVDNEAITRKGPTGVPIHACKWKV